MAAQTTELYAAVVQYIESEKTWDGLAKRTAFMNHLMGKGKKKINGGLYIQFPIKLVANASSAFISGTNSLVDINPSIQLQYGVLNWKYYNFAINFTLQDFNVANGKEEVVDFMAEKTEGALSDAVREWSQAAHIGTFSAAAGTQSTYPLKLDGLLDFCVASGTSYAGLTNTDYTSGYYLPIIDSTTATMNYTNINLGINKLKGRMQKEMSPSGILGIMNPATYSRFQSSVQNAQRFTEESTLKAGSEGFKVNGIDFVLDSDCPGTQDGSTADNMCYIFPTDIMKMYYHFGFGSKSPFDGEVRMPNQPIMSTQHFVSFNLVCVNRRLIHQWTALVA
jgi:hypothetical protein